MLFLLSCCAFLVPNFCFQEPALSVGQELQGQIETGFAAISVEEMSATFLDAETPPRGKKYHLEVEESGTYSLVMEAYLFQPFLLIYGSGGAILAESELTQPSTQANLTLSLESAVQYEVWVCSRRGAAGPFTLKCDLGALPDRSPAEHLKFYLGELQESTRQLKAKYGENHALTAWAWIELGEALLRNQLPQEALEPLQRGLSILEAATPPDFEEISLGNYGLGWAYLSMNETEKAIPHMERTVELRRKLGDAESRSFANTLGNLAYCYNDLGNLPLALARAEEALQILKGLGDEGLAGAAELSNYLGNICGELRDESKTRFYFNEAVRLIQQLNGEGSADEAAYRSNFADSLRELKQPEEALKQSEMAIQMEEALFGKEHPMLPYRLSVYGLILLDLDRFQEAIEVFQRARDLFRQVSGEDNANEANICNSLGMAYFYSGKFTPAEKLLKRSEELWIRLRGPDNLHVHTAAFHRAIIAFESGRTKDGIGKLIESLQHGSDLLRENLSQMSEKAGLAYLERFRIARYYLQSKVHFLEDPAERRQVYELLAPWKGIVGELLVTGLQGLAASMDESQKQLLGQLRQLQAELSWLANAPDSSQEGERSQRIENLQTQREKLERELRLESENFQGNRQEWTVSEISENLPPGSAWIDFYDYRHYDRGRYEGEKFMPNWGEERRCGAWLIRAQDPDPVWVELAKVEDLRRLVEKYRIGMTGERARTRGGRPLNKGGRPLDKGGRPSNNARSTTAKAGLELRRVLWDPLAFQLQGVQQLFVSPDSFLGALPLESILLKEDRYLIEDYSVVYLSHPALLAQSKTRSRTTQPSLLVMGNVDFDSLQNSDLEPLSHSSDSTNSPTNSFRGFRGDWQALPATADEAQRILELHRKRFGKEESQMFLQKREADETRLKEAIPHYQVLHLATHGYFRPSGFVSNWSSSVEAETASEESPSRKPSMAEIVLSPGLLTGLVCSGVNSESVGGSDDGFLTAEEVSWMDLSDVELVVLSACETGLGKEQPGEGLLGLRRSFRLAGARSVVSSLWMVPDQSTHDLMVDFYQNLWVRGMGTYESLRQAQLHMLNHNRAKYGQGLPSTWAAFVFEGGWR